MVSNIEWNKQRRVSITGALEVNQLGKHFPCADNDIETPCFNIALRSVICNYSGISVTGLILI